MEKYHVALSFAGEDRDYVEEVANVLRDSGVHVFYDKFEETKLWGKNLYTYLRDIYKNRAIYTVIFVSLHYKDKIWTNHERESAQARAIEESKEYILPAKFDIDVEIPGLLKTTGYIDLNKYTPSEFAYIIIKKLTDDGVTLNDDDEYIYSNEAKADIDFPVPSGDAISDIIVDMRSSNWYTQNPAVEKLFKLDWKQVTPDQAFVIGRNIYQCADGNENRSVQIMENLRRELPMFPHGAAIHVLNGMFYELYFNSKGEFRGNDLKARHISNLFSIQTVQKYQDSIKFIRKAMGKYSLYVALLPNIKPEIVSIDVDIEDSDPPVIKSVKFEGDELITQIDKNYEDIYDRLWTLSFRKFSLKSMIDRLYETWHVPHGQLKANYTFEKDSESLFQLAKEKTIKPPYQIWKVEP